jgi:hypothetical protein
MRQFIQVASNETNSSLAQLQNKFLKNFERECNINFHISMFESCNMKLSRKEAEEIVDEIIPNI